MSRATAESKLSAAKRSAAAGLAETGPLGPWYARVGLLLLSVLLLSLSFAPVYQFYLAWIGLAPWLLVVARAPSKKSAFAWGLGGAWAFFLANMWWLWSVSPPGLVALTLYLAIFWGLAALTIRSLWRALLPALPEGEGTRRRPVVAIVLIPAAWVAFEWLRGNVSFLGKQGLPWLYLGQTQSPFLVLAQVADFASVLGVSFWVAMINVVLALLVLYRRQMRAVIPAVAATAAVMVGVAGYGAFRLSQETTYPGPSVLVVQSNYKQSNTGEKGATTEEILRFHLTETRSALEAERSAGRAVHLVVWSETMMPPLNAGAREVARGSSAGKLWQAAHDMISETAREFGTSMLVGGTYLGGWTERHEGLVATERRNTAYFFDAAGRLADRIYAKIHLVPFGEYIPFKHTIPPLYRVFIHLGPPYYEEYVLARGTEFTVFELEREGGGGEPVRFVVPICFEDIVPSLVASMVDGRGGQKRADLLINITNDGWFRANQMPQHLQAALFRSIENRVPTARSVNTGISGFVDPLGRVSNTVAAETEGSAVARVLLDRRVAPYTRIGDVFPMLCVAATAVAIVILPLVQSKRGATRERSTETAE